MASEENRLIWCQSSKERKISTQEALLYQQLQELSQLACSLLFLYLAAASIAFFTLADAV